MGFKNGARAKVWSIEPGPTEKMTKIRISVSRKQGDQFIQDFGGFVTCIGSANEKAKRLTEGSTIVLSECDVSTTYDKVRQKEYINYKLFDFDVDGDKAPSKEEKPRAKKPSKKAAFDDEGDADEDDPDDFPF